VNHASSCSSVRGNARAFRATPLEMPNGRRIPSPPAGRSSKPSSRVSRNVASPFSDSAVGALSQRIHVWSPRRLSTWRCGTPNVSRTSETACAAAAFSSGEVSSALFAP